MLNSFFNRLILTNNFLPTQLVPRLATISLGVSMNMYNPWVVEPWHIRMAFKRINLMVPDEAIQIPAKEIKGPDFELEGREFITRVTVRKRLFQG